METSFVDLLYVASVGVYSKSLWDALLSDLPSTDMYTSWLRALLFIGCFSLLTFPYWATRKWVFPRIIQWAVDYRRKRRQQKNGSDTYVV